jgi:hypothetical protein
MNFDLSERMSGHIEHCKSENRENSRKLSNNFIYVRQQVFSLFIDIEHIFKYLRLAHRSLS